MKRAGFSTVIALALALCVSPQHSSAREQPAPPVLGIEKSRFTVNGKPKFLLFLSYFDAMRRRDRGAQALNADLDFIHDTFDGIRILPNWLAYDCAADGDDDADDTLFEADGTLDEDRWKIFVAVLDAAAAKGLIVDATFTYETVPGLVSMENYRKQIADVAARLAGKYPHVFFDMQNEHNLHWPGDARQHQSEAAAIRNAIKAADPKRLVTISTSDGAEALAAAMAFDIIAVHDERAGDWHQAAGARRAMTRVRAAAQAAGKPVYFQEPMPISRFDRGGCGNQVDRVALRHRQAAAHAKANGAAAWTFHTRTTFDLSARGYKQKLASGQFRTEKSELLALRRLAPRR